VPLASGRDRDDVSLANYISYRQRLELCCGTVPLGNDGSRCCSLAAERGCLTTGGPGDRDAGRSLKAQNT
jgi:hypothetical protein